MINLVLLTGFLGAGKTTLMCETLEAFSDKKVGVIVNEFGSVNIDAVLIEKEGIQMAELSNGSIFCACIKDKFVDSLIEMSKMDMEYLFVEASGLADPSNMVQILAGIRKHLGNDYDYKGSLCIVDGENFIDLCELLPAVTSQLEFCSSIIINKADLIDEAQLKKVQDKIREINDKSSQHVTSFCKVDIRNIIEEMGEKEEKQDRETSNTEETRLHTFIVKGEKVVPYEKLRSFVEEVVGESYRVKGFVKTDKGNIEVSTVGKNITFSNWEKPFEKSEIVLISAVGFKLISTITKAIDKNLKGIMNI